MPILLPTVNNERRQWKQHPQFRIPSHTSFIPNHQLGQKSKIFLLRLPCNRCPHTPEVYVAQTGMPLAFSTAQVRKPLPLPPTALCVPWGLLACSGTSGLSSIMGCGSLHWTMTSRGQVPHIITPWTCCGSARASGCHINQIRHINQTSADFLSFALSHHGQQLPWFFLFNLRNTER